MKIELSYHAGDGMIGTALESIGRISRDVYNFAMYTLWELRNINGLSYEELYGGGLVVANNMRASEIPLSADWNEFCNYVRVFYPYDKEDLVYFSDNMLNQLAWDAKNDLEKNGWVEQYTSNDKKLFPVTKKDLWIDKENQCICLNKLELKKIDKKYCLHPIERSSFVRKGNDFIITIWFNPRVYAGIDLGMSVPVALVTSQDALLITDKRMYDLNHEFVRKKRNMVRTNSVKPKKALATLNKKFDQDLKGAITIISKYVANWCVEHGVTNVVIGNPYEDNTLDGQVMQKLSKGIATKLLSLKITAQVIDENYTSVASFVDKDPIMYSHSYSGERVDRDTYVTMSGEMIHADLNGAGNICRLINPSFEVDLDVLQNPVVVDFVG